MHNLDEKFDEYEDNIFSEEQEPFVTMAPEEGGLSEEMELSLASDLLNAKTDEEMEQFWGALAGALASTGIGKKFISTVGKQGLRRVTGLWKRNAQRRKRRGQCSSLSTLRRRSPYKNLFRELEAFDDEEAEFEEALRLVRLGPEVAKELERMGGPTDPANVRKAFEVAARRVAGVESSEFENERDDETWQKGWWRKDGSGFQFKTA